MLADLADQAGMAFRNAQLTAELATRVHQLDSHTHELNQSPARLISAGDAKPSRVERAISRQVIPYLALLPNRLRRLSESGPDGHTAADAAQLGPLLTAMDTAMQSLREITRGVLPAQLSRSGLRTALGSLLARPGLTGRLTVEESATGVRFDPRVEAATYFCVVEATHALDQPMAVTLAVHGDQLHLRVSDTETGGLSLSHMRDRIKAAGGSVPATRRGGDTVVEVLAPSTGHQQGSERGAIPR